MIFVTRNCCKTEIILCYTYMLAYTCTSIQTHTCIHACVHTHKHKGMHYTTIHIRIHLYINVQTWLLTCILTYTHEYTDAHTHKCMHECIDTYTHTYTRGTWWRLGWVNYFQPKGLGFDSRSSRNVGTLSKSFTCSCLCASAWNSDTVSVL